MSKGYYTFFSKNPSTKFVVKNVAPYGKRVKVFNYPIVNGATRDLLSIPEISEATIRHSLLKGELINKFRCGELIVVDSDIDLLQFNSEQKAFLQSIGITKGLDASGTIPFLWKQNVALIGTQDGSNRTFTTPDKFIDGTFDSNTFHISIRVDGQTMAVDEDFVISESGGAGTGYDTIEFTSFIPESFHYIRVSYVIEAP